MLKFIKHCCYLDWMDLDGKRDEEREKDLSATVK